MISMIQNLHIGNALRLFLMPPAGARLWKVLRKVADNFTGADDPDAFLAYQGTEKYFVDAEYLPNEVMQFYKPYYSSDNGITWVPGATRSGTPTADYQDFSTDVLGIVRQRLEDGLKVECDRGNFQPEHGYIQVFTAPPSLERDLRLPLVTVHLENESPAERGIGEELDVDEFDAVGNDWSDSQGWLASVTLTIIGWSLNSDERIELRKAIRRIIVGNLEVFSNDGVSQVDFSLNDVDAVNGEYPAPIFQVMCNFTCIAPVRVGGRVDAISTIISRSN